MKPIRLSLVRFLSFPTHSLARILRPASRINSWIVEEKAASDRLRPPAPRSNFGGGRVFQASQGGCPLTALRSRIARLKTLSAYATKVVFESQSKPGIEGVCPKWNEAGRRSAAIERRPRQSKLGAHEASAASCCLFWHLGQLRGC